MMNIPQVLTIFTLSLLHKCKSTVTLPSILVNDSKGILVPVVHDSAVADFGEEFEDGAQYSSNLYLPPFSHNQHNTIFLSHYFCFSPYVSKNTGKRRTIKEDIDTETEAERELEFVYDYQKGVNPLVNLGMIHPDMDINDYFRKLKGNRVVDFDESMSRQHTHIRSGTRTRLLQQDHSRESALLVRRGRCSFEAKAEAAMELNRQFARLQDSEDDDQSQLIKYLIVYDNQKESETNLVTMTGSSRNANSNRNKDDSAEEDQIDIKLVFVNSTAGLQMTQELHNKFYGKDKYNEDEKYADSDESDSPGASSIPVIMNSDRLSPDGTLAPSTRDKTSWGLPFYKASEGIGWLRFVLCGMLLIFPCIRACLIWYNSGGRIRLVRREDGRYVLIGKIRFSCFCSLILQTYIFLLLQKIWLSIHSSESKMDCSCCRCHPRR